MTDGVDDRVEARSHLAHQRRKSRGQRRDVGLVDKLTDDDDRRVGRPGHQPEADVRQRDLGDPDLCASGPRILLMDE